MSELLIINGRVIDPRSGVDGIADVRIEKGKIVAVGPNLTRSEGARIYDASEKWVVPGLIDIHTHLRDPGYEYKETIETGGKSAAAGGFTSICCMANTKPVNDNGEITDYIINTAKATSPVNVYPIGALTKGLGGEVLANIGEMAERGVVALSDDGRCVQNGAVMRAAVEYAKMFGLVVMEHAEDGCLNSGGVMNEGLVATEMGLVGFPRIAEDVIVARDVALADYLDANIHIAHVSTRGTVELIRDAKKRGVKITGEAAPHHFTLTDEACRGYNTNAKMAPPLREEDDVRAIKEGLADGTLDCIATDHAPHAVDDKEVEFDHAAFGIVGFETAVPLSLALVREGVLTPTRLIEAMAARPAEIVRLDRGTLAVGAVADVTVIDPAVEWTVDPTRFATKGRNTPFAGWQVQGRAVATIVKGKIVYEC
ncbi:MAG: dihydroorotase [Nitrospinae bacterium]|nr:dihydroorotase [Nitrospinota bacterium]